MSQSKKQLFIHYQMVPEKTTASCLSHIRRKLNKYSSY